MYFAIRLASPSLDPMSGHACGMTVDEEERRHIFVVYNKRGKDVDTDDGSRDAIQSCLGIYMRNYAILKL